MLEESAHFGGGSLGLAVHVPDHGLLTGGVGEGLTQAEAGSDGEAEGLGGDEQFVGEPVVLLELVRDERPSRFLAADAVNLIQCPDRFACRAEVQG